MADEKIIPIVITTDTTQVDAAGKSLDGLGNSADKATTSVGGMRKELRATTEVTKALGESMGESGKSMAAIGEGGRLAFAGIELLNGGLKELAIVILANPLFILAGVLAVVVGVMISMNKAAEEQSKAFAKVNEELSKYNDSNTKIFDKTKKNQIDLDVEGKKYSKAEGERRKKELDGLREQADAHAEYLEKVKAINADEKTSADQKNSAIRKLDIIYFDKQTELATNNKQEIELINKQAFDEENKTIDDNAKKAAEAEKKRVEASGKAWMKEIKDKEAALDAENKRDEIAGEAWMEEEKKKMEAEKAFQQLTIDQDATNEKVAADNVKIDNDTIKRLEAKKKLQGAAFADEAQLIAERNKLIDDEYTQEEAALETKTDKETLAVEQSTKSEDEKAAAILQINQDYTDQSNALADLRTQHQLDNNKKEIDDNKAKVESMLKDATTVTTDIMGLADSILQNEVTNKAASKAAQLKAAKEEFQINKALQLVNAGINTAAAIVKAAPVIPLEILAAVTGALSIAAIASKNFTGTETSAGAVPTPPTSSATQFAAPTFFGLGGQSTQNANSAPPPQKVYVTEGDITKVQNKVANIKSYSKISLTQH
jgi:hypothetical protein